MLVKKSKIISVVLALLITSVSPAFAQSDRKLPRPPVESSGSFIINWKKLDLTVKQIQKIRSLRLDFQKMSIRLSSEIDLKQLEIEKLLISPISEPDSIRKLLRQRLSIEAKLRMAALDNFLSIKSLLSSDQLAKLPQATSLK